MSPLSFLDFPLELIVAIFQELHFVDIFSCMRVCRTISKIVMNSVRLSYHIQLQRLNLHDNPRCRLPVTERLKVLLEREQRWASLTWKKTFSIPLPADSGTPVRITSSALLMGIERQEPGHWTAQGQWAFEGLRIAAFNSQDLMRISWKDIDLGGDIYAVRAAIEEHDLIACIARTPSPTNPDIIDFTVHLLRYSTTDLHDTPKDSLLPLFSAKSREGFRFTIEICDNNLVILYYKIGCSPYASCMVVYDWKTGRNKTPIKPVLVPSKDIIFLREDITAHPNSSENSIDLYHIPSSANFDSDTKTEVQFIRRLLFPPHTDPYRLTIAFKSECYSNPTGTHTCPEFLSDSKPFKNDHAYHILFLYFVFHSTNPETFNAVKLFALATHRKALLDHVPSPPFTNNGFYGTLAWEKWGPPVVRWFNMMSTPDYYAISTPFGQRCVAVTDDSEDPYSDRDRNIQVFDFNPWTVRMAQQGLIEGCVVVGSHQENLDVQDAEQREEAPENVCGHDMVFCADVVGRLPYTTTKSVKWLHSGLPMMNDALISAQDVTGAEKILHLMYFG